MNNFGCWASFHEILSAETGPGTGLMSEELLLMRHIGIGRIQNALDRTRVIILGWNRTELENSRDYSRLCLVAKILQGYDWAL
jgi:hypothetical protein